MNPRQCGGRPCIRGVRIRAGDVLDFLASGMSRDEIVSDYPELEPEGIEAALKFAVGGKARTPTTGIRVDLRPADASR